MNFKIEQRSDGHYVVHESGWPHLKISRRVKHGCCYRLNSKRMCGRPVSREWGPSDYCGKHALLLAGASARASVQEMGTELK